MPGCRRGQRSLSADAAAHLPSAQGITAPFASVSHATSLPTQHRGWKSIWPGTEDLLHHSLEQDSQVTSTKRQSFYYIPAGVKKSQCHVPADKFIPTKSVYPLDLTRTVPVVTTPKRHAEAVAWVKKSRAPNLPRNHHADNNKIHFGLIKPLNHRECSPRRLHLPLQCRCHSLQLPARH